MNTIYQSIRYLLFSALSVMGAVLFSACGDFLEEYSTDQRYCENAQDLEDLMIGEAFLPTNNLSTYSPGSLSPENMVSYNMAYIHVLDDDADVLMLNNYVQSSSTCSPLHVLGAMYRWAADPNMDDLNKKWTDGSWANIYKRIGAINAIIFQSEKIQPKNDADEKLMAHVAGEAHFLRAFYYLQLANVYGLPYAKATANTDLCVPLKISETIEDRYFSRNTNAEVWGQIAQDLDIAAEQLKGYNPETKLRAGYYAVKALQTRVALYMEDYEKVLECASVFDTPVSPYALTDLNTHAMGENILCKSSKDAIFTMSQNEIPCIFADEGTAYDSNWMPYAVASCFRASDDLMEKYENSDLRLTHYFRHTSTTNSVMPDKYKTWATYNDKEGVSAMFLLRLAEVVLNKAEAQLMLGRNNEAAQTINALRAKRFASASPAPADGNQLMNFIRDERRRELCFEGHRWFDLRRYAVNSKYPLSSDYTITHPAYAYNESKGTAEQVGYYVLESYQKDQAAWVIPVPDETINFNRGEIQNLVRKTREMKH